MTDRKLLAEYKLWARDGWAAGGRRKARTIATSVSRVVAKRNPNEQVSATPQEKREQPMPIARTGRSKPAVHVASKGFGGVKINAPLAVAKLNLSAWIDDDWAAPLGVKRHRKPVARINVPRPQAFKKIKAAAPSNEPKKRRKHGAPSVWDAVPPEPQSESEDDEAVPEPVKNYAPLHKQPNTFMYQGRKTRVQWDDLFDFLSSKGWRTVKTRMFNGIEATIYLAPNGKFKDDGGKLGRDYFLSHEGVLQYLEEHQHVLQDFFD